MSAATMKAVRIFEHGGPDVLRYGSYELPSPGPEELLVKVLATSLSLWDVMYRKGAWLESGIIAPLAGRKMFPLPMQSGRDAVGVVEAIGDNVQRFKVGQRVIGLPHPSNPACAFSIRGLSNLSTGIDLPGHQMFGGHAQYVARPENYWTALPDGVEPATAAAAMWSYATSHRVIADRIGVRLNDVVLITGTSGGMGSAAAELAKLAGARVIGLTRKESKAAGLRQSGVDHVVILTDDHAQVVERIRELSGGVGVDAAVEYTSNPKVLRLCLESLRLGGTLVPGAAQWARDPMPISALDMIRIEPNVRGVRGSTLNDQRIVVELLAQRRIQPKIHSVLPLSRIAEAHTLLERGEVEGRIVLDPWL